MKNNNSNRLRIEYVNYVILDGQTMVGDVTPSHALEVPNMHFRS